MRRVGHLGSIGEGRSVRIIWGDLSEGGHLEELGRDRMKLFRMFFKE